MSAWMFWTRRAHLRAEPKPFAVAAGRRVYAVGDIHGRDDLLATLLARIRTEIAGAPELSHTAVFLGDYIDRGSDSAKVIDRLLAFGAETSCVFLKGNHEAILMAYLHDHETLAAWAEAGGLLTLTSYGLAPSLRTSAAESPALHAAFLEAFPPEHHAFIQRLRPAYAVDGYFFAHAGVRPGVPLAAQAEEDLLWIRGDFLDDDALHEKRIVHGHTPVKQPDVRANRINIDTGAFATGRLTGLVIEGSSIRFL